MAKILVLEDDQNRIKVFKEKLNNIHDVTYVDTAKDAIKNLRDELFDVVFLDHDLGGETYVDANDKNTGSEVVRYMIKDSFTKSPSVIVHSLNAPAAEDMENKLSYVGLAVYRIPFTTLVDRHLEDPSFIQ